MKVDFPATILNIDPEPQVATSPISQLPIDPLLAIFHTAVLAFDASALLPITLSHVCARWRDLALSTSTLWRNIVVMNKLETSSSSIEKTLKRVQAFLNLSRECTLSIDMTFDSWSLHEGETDPENPYVINLPFFRARIGDISRTIAQYAHRIRNFKLTVDEFESTAAVMRGLGPVQMPVLETWHVRNTYEDHAFNHPGNEPEYEEEVHAHSLLLRPDANTNDDSFPYPKLRRVNLRSTPLHWGRFSPRNLVSLELGMLQVASRPSSPDLHKILLASAHSLVRVALYAALKGDDWIGTCALPKLELLELGFTNTSEVIPFLSALQAPNLRRLAICDLMRQNHCACLGLGEAFDPNIAQFFNVMMQRLPLENLRYLALSHIALCPPPSGIPAPASHIEMYTAALTFALKFFCQLTAVAELVLSGPDRATMEALNHVLPSNMERHGTTAPRYPTPRLRNLVVADAPFLVLHHFVKERVTNRKMFRPFDGFIVSMPRSWYELVEWVLLDVSVLARNVSPRISCAHHHETETHILAV
ncbi:hypothetical protein LshimejAT787_0311610 [Lyophyllum shimeji]|uniref:F-box domain-containing protein n=1 Tax=Lyophyllum shimeji TaxID=47721 RepID=A0A9P3PK04_LYOSH|nr:hypothetical protein LshimejAT787_0311610 [Lyophyllum shimeji]